MAARRINPVSRASARPVQRGAEVKEAAKNAPTGDDDRTYTHQGPGTGQAGAADPKASAAILRSGKGATPTVEPKAAATAAESKAASVETAGEAIRARLADERLKLGASDDDDTGTLSTPRTPGQQASDSGTAGTGPSMGGGKTGSEAAAGGGSGSAASSSGSTGSGTATSEGARDPFGTNTLTDRLDATTASALSQLDAARPNLRGGLDIFQSVTETSNAPASSASSHQDQLAAAAGGSKSNPGQTASDPGEEHAANAAGQLTGGRGSAGSMLGDRLGDAKGELGIMEGLLGDASAKEDGKGAPSIADDDDLADAAVNTVGGGMAVVSAAGVIEQAAGAAALVGVEAGAAAAGAGVVAAGVIGWTVGSSIEEATRPATGWANEAIHSAFEESTEETAAKGKAAYLEGLGRKIARRAAEDARSGGTDGGTGGGVKDPGEPGSGMPTEAEMAFRASLRAALGAPRTGSGDVDPADNGGAPVGGSHFAGAANDNLGLIGQPAGPGAGASGTVHSPTTGTDVDPLEGSAFSGPALGGNPEDLRFGSETLPLESLPRSSSSDDDDSSEDSSNKDEDDDA